MFNRAAYANTRPDGVAVLEVVDERGEDAAPRFVSLKRTVLRGAVTGPLADLRVTHVYGYTRAQCDQVIEALYRFPLPGDAAVTAVAVRFGDVEIQAGLRARDEAEAAYEQARAEGRQAALATRESPDVFTLRVSGIRPDEDVTVETSYVQLARPDGTGWSLRAPLATAPRYVRSDERTSRPAQGQPLALLRDPGHRFALDVTLAGAASASSATHELATTPVEDGLRVQLAAGEVVPDRDLVLSWQLPQADRPALQVWWHDDAVAGQVYWLAAITPPASGPASHGLPREVLLLVDHSGSMTGPKWPASDWAVQRFLGELTPEDALALALFHSETHWFKKPTQAAVRATPAAVQEAIAFLLKERSTGGTELGVALEQALSVPRAEGVSGRQVLVITDAQVSDEARVLRLAEDERARAAPRRINILCIDAAPNSFLALELAERGGGVARFVTSDPEEEDISTALDDVLADWAAPVVVGLTLTANRPSIRAAGRLHAPNGDGAAVDCGDLPAGRSVWVVGCMPRGDGSPVQLRLQAPGAPALDAVADLAAGNDHPAIRALYGARQVLALEFLVGSGRDPAEVADRLARLGYDPATVPALAPRMYAENARMDLEAALRDLLVQESLRFGIVSSETAFVAVRTERGTPVHALIPVAGALPSGWSPEFLTPAMGAHRAMFAAPALTPSMMVRYRTDSLSPVLHEDSGPAPRRGPVVAWDGAPPVAAGRAVLFDTERAEDAARWSGASMLLALSVRFPAGAPPALDPGLELWLFVGDMAAPRARVRLADVVRAGGERPLNVAVRAGDRVQLVLVDPAGAWAAEAPHLVVELTGA